MHDTAKLSRIEVIDETGRVFVRYPKTVELSFQDDNRTLKVFISGSAKRDDYPPPLCSSDCCR